jgi:hypothetical protein
MGSFYSDLKSLSMFDETIMHQPENPTKRLNLLLRHGSSRLNLEKFLKEGLTRQFSFNGEGWGGIRGHIRYCEKNGWRFSCDIGELIKANDDNAIIKIVGFGPPTSGDSRNKPSIPKKVVNSSKTKAAHITSSFEKSAPNMVKPLVEVQDKHHIKANHDDLSIILSRIASKVRERVDSLDHVFRFKRSGIEAWFKVEVVAALGGLVVSLNNKGPDLTLSNGMMIELKGATDFNPSYLRDGALKDKVPCLFLGNGEEERSISRLKSMTSIHVVGLEFIKGHYKWVVGCIVPANKI